MTIQTYFYSISAFKGNKGKNTYQLTYRDNIKYIYSDTLIFIYGCGHTQFKCICVNECSHICEILLVKYLLSTLCTDIITSYVLSILNKQLTVFY